MSVATPVVVLNTGSNPVPVSFNVSEQVNAQTGTSYTILSADWGKLITFSNGSATAVTLPQANSTSFPNGYFIDVVNLGAGTVTITPTTSTIQGAATLAVVTGEGFRIVSDGTNYFYQPGSGGTFDLGVVPGTIAASRAIVVDSNKDAAIARNFSAVNLKAGASGTAGTVDVFPTTAAKGKTEFTAADNSGDTTTAIATAAQTGARTYTVPDAGGSASFVMTAGAQTVAGAKTFSTMPIIPSATVAATGADQAGAASITTGFTLVTAADGTTGVKLPAAVAGLVCIVKNIDVANAILKVYPASGDAINAITADAALSMAAKTSAVFVAYDTTTWYTVPLLPS